MNRTTRRMADLAMACVLACSFPQALRADTLRGIVLDELRTPVPGAIVYVGTPQLPIRMQNNAILTGERYPRALTDSGGRFQVENAPAGKAIVLARDLEDRTGLAEVTADEIEVIINRPGQLEAHLASDKGLQQGEELHLIASAAPSLQYTFNVTSRRQPPYRFDNLLPGEYLLETTHQVPQVGCSFGKVVTRQVTATLTPGTTKEVQLDRPDLPAVAGRITDTDGNGLHGVWVRLVPESNVKPALQFASFAGDAASAPRVWSTVSERDGTYRIDGVPPGAYTLRAFRRLAQNSATHTFEIVADVAVPKDTPTARTPIVHDLTVDLDRFAPLQVGDVAPDFEGTDLDGNPLRLADLRGRVVVLHFFAAWCTPCVDTIDDFNTLARDFADAPLSVIGISLDETESQAKAFASEKKLNHPVLYRGSWSQNDLREQYHVNAIPYTVTIGPDGTIVRQNLHGELLHEDVARHLDGL